ncbi:MAG: nitroreductase family protein [Desulfobulbaceae bacterium]|nr:nitroreductase family protein [Desulfobulbaceae bacterium]
MAATFSLNAAGYAVAGHICQNVIMAAETLGLGACPVAVFFDDELNDLLDIDGKEESVIYLASVGAKG